MHADENRYRFSALYVVVRWRRLNCAPKLNGIVSRRKEISRGPPILSLTGPRKLSSLVNPDKDVYKAT